MTQLTVHLDSGGHILIRVTSDDDSLVIQVDAENAERLADALVLASTRSVEVQTLFSDVEEIFATGT